MYFQEDIQYYYISVDIIAASLAHIYILDGGIPVYKKNS